MKHAAILCMLISFCHGLAFSQRVDSIKVEQSGDFIKVRYKILDSKPGEMYNVKVLCSINGGLNTEIRSVSGDTGDMVQGGKNEYWVVWDVLKDVDEVKSVDFIVRAERKVQAKLPKENGHIVNLSPAIQFPGPGFGVRFGVMGKFGVSLQFISWKAVLIGNPVYTGDLESKRFSLALASRLMHKEKSQIHILTGFTVGNSLIEEKYVDNGSSTYVIHFKKTMTPGPELGIAVSSGRMIFTLTGAKLLTNMTEEGQDIAKNNFVSASVGFRF